MKQQDQPTIAYILKGFPRNSEAFITNEIHELEALGLRFMIISAFPGDPTPSSTACNIHSRVTYLPEEAAAIDSSFWGWLKANLPRYAPSHIWLFCRRPLSYFKVLGQAIMFSFSLRKDWGFRPKKAMYKEFVRAGCIAYHVLKGKTIRHLHAHFCHGSTTMAMFASALTGIPFSFTAHAKDIYLPQLNPGNLLAIKLQRTAFVATCTDFNRQHLQKVFPHASKVHRVYHGVNIDRFSPRPKQTTDVPVILSVGRHVRKKGFSYLLEAFALLRKRGHDFQGIILGEPDEETPRIQELIASLKLEHTVALKPGVTQDELGDMYHRATIFALACHVVNNGDRDGIPNVLAEAMACGIPIVSTDVSGIPELVTHQENGLLVPPKDPEALAKAMEELLVDPALQTTLAAAGRQKILRMFDAKSNILSLFNLFQHHIPLESVTTGSSAYLGMASDLKPAPHERPVNVK